MLLLCYTGSDQEIRRSGDMIRKKHQSCLCQLPADFSFCAKKKKLLKWSHRHYFYFQCTKGQGRDGEEQAASRTEATAFILLTHTGSLQAAQTAYLHKTKVLSVCRPQASRQSPNWRQQNQGRAFLPLHVATVESLQWLLWSPFEHVIMLLGCCYE